MITKNEMDLIRNLARNQVRAHVDFDELVNEAVQAILTEKEKAGIANDGILIAIARRAMINLKLSRKLPVSFPDGSHQRIQSGAEIIVTRRGKVYRYRAKEIITISEFDVERGKPTTWADQRRHEKLMAYRVALNIARKESGDAEIFTALENGMTIRDITSTVEGASFHTVVKFREKIKTILKKMGF